MRLREAEHFAQRGIGENLVWWTLRNHTLRNQNRRIGSVGITQLVRGHHDTDSPAAFFRDEICNESSTGDVESRGRFVEQENIAFARQHLREMRALLLTAGQITQRTMTELDGTRSPHRRLDDIEILAAHAAEQSVTRESTHHHHVLDA